MSALRGIILAIWFACELALVVALGYWGFQAVDGTPAWLLGIGAPAVAGQPRLAALLAVAAGITSILNAVTASDDTRSAV
jgi:hypothetical protein